METKTDKTLKLTRLINAPRELVFNAWVDADQLAQWWGPKGFTNPVCAIDVKPGGKIDIDMLGPDGIIYPMDGEFLEIKKPERLVFIASPLDKNGNRLFEVLNTITFTDEGGKTRLSLTAEASKLKSEGQHHLDGMNQGWNESLDRLADLVTSAL